MEQANHLQGSKGIPCFLSSPKSNHIVGLQVPSDHVPPSLPSPVSRLPSPAFWCMSHRNSVLQKLPAERCSFGTGLMVSWCLPLTFFGIWWCLWIYLFSDRAAWCCQVPGLKWSSCLSSHIHIQLELCITIPTTTSSRNHTFMVLVMSVAYERLVHLFSPEQWFYAFKKMKRRAL